MTLAAVFFIMNVDISEKTENRTMTLKLEEAMSFRILISPAKKMRADPDSLECLGLPDFLPWTEKLLVCLRSMPYDELKHLWRCNDAIARLNFDRVRNMRLRDMLTPAILAYEGIQYQYMAPGVFTYEELAYIQERLRILSGFYGLLRPFDGVVPYRLEMQARLRVGDAKDLYAFWGNSLARALCSETEQILNLASKEYSRCVSSHLSSSVRFVTCVFGERKNGKLLEKGTLCKMARGEMVRYMAENKIQRLEEIQNFRGLGFHFSPEESQMDTFVFERVGKYVPGAQGFT